MVNIIKPAVELLTPISKDGLEELKHIEQVGRVCYRSEDKITDDGESAKRFVGMLIRLGHEAMIEHGTVSFRITCDRGVSHELVRHRLASFAQESQRYVNYSKEKFDNCITVIDPFANPYIKDAVSAEKIDFLHKLWLENVENCNDAYLLMISAGASPQVARSILPNSTATTIVMTANYREWRHFLKLRCAPTAHPQMREIAGMILAVLQEKLPVLFDDINMEGEN